MPLEVVWQNRTMTQRSTPRHAARPTRKHPDTGPRARTSPRALRDAVEELREGDGVDPRYERAEGAPHPARVGDLRLATRIARTLSMIFAGSSEPMVSALRVDKVEHVSRGGTFSVRLVPAEGVTDFDADAARKRVAGLAGRLRAEVSQAIRRKRAPYLRFEIMPARGWAAQDAPADRSPAVAPVQRPPSQAAPGRGPELHESPSAADTAQPRRSASASRLKRGHHGVPVAIWSPDKGLPPGVEGDLRQICASPDVHYIAVMPDVHRGHRIPNGLVLATHRLIYPEAVGADAGCGVLAARLAVAASALKSARIASEVLSVLMRAVPVLKRTRRHPTVALPADLANDHLSSPSLENAKRRDGTLQLGTLGRGNHFLEVQVMATGEAWIMIHTGSRGLGQAIFAHHARNASSGDTRLLVLDSETAAGRAYLADFGWALRYASANRQAILGACDEALQARLGFGVEPGTVIDVPHNFLRFEEHAGERLWVHRKSALSAARGELTLVPGSMAGPSFHVIGRGSAESLDSCAHGAGRCMSRTEARRKVSPASLRRQMQGVTFDERSQEALVEEAPEAYKDPRAVMRAQRDLVRTARQLKPLISYKAP